jgi:hypothetical protein
VIAGLTILPSCFSIYKIRQACHVKRFKFDEDDMVCRPASACVRVSLTQAPCLHRHDPPARAVYIGFWPPARRVAFEYMSSISLSAGHGRHMYMRLLLRLQRWRDGKLLLLHEHVQLVHVLEGERAGHAGDAGHRGHAGHAGDVAAN